MCSCFLTRCAVILCAVMLGIAGVLPLPNAGVKGALRGAGAIAHASPLSSLVRLSEISSGIDPDLEAQVLEILRRHPEVILESVSEYRQDQERQQRQRQAALLDAIKTNPQSFIQKSPMEGAIAPQLLIIEFSDFQCPYCAQAHDTLKQFVADHRDQVSLVYKHYPLEQIHPEAMAAAKAAWAANRQGKFWTYHDFLFDHQQELGEDLYLEAAEAVGLNLEQFNRNRNGEGAIAAIEADIQLAEELGIGGTPFFLLNGSPAAGLLQRSFLEERLANS